MVFLYHDAYGQSDRRCRGRLPLFYAGRVVLGPSLVPERRLQVGGLLSRAAGLCLVCSPCDGFLALQNRTLAIFRDPGSLDACQLLFCFSSQVLRVGAH
ncbi:hypothetical protein INT43_009147 [Umbelopsis isabellina]|uniref:Uncharacterized protein n=1 Tax=Mortierella isabellina TaxID=91625 RepID=A0A8H7U6P1_MORIS|nr:hypothetical protein INT43_009147 [Umbelopsis isabellina]